MAYSECDLIDKELKQNSFLSRIFESRNVHVKLMLPNDIYFRAKVLCEDVYNMTDKHFTLDNLVQMLWNDFLSDVIAKQDIKYIYKLLLDYDRGTTNVRLEQYNEQKVEDVPLYPVRKRVDKAEHEIFYCRLPRKDVLRGEVMLSDIDKVYPNHHLKMERVLEILLIDFIEKYEKGEAKSIIKELLVDE
ncbi:hypothetical protein [Alkalihalobacillus sp. 1P02AB]|uniref:hypothetical protein n=1 Tax=Alkalihalobacillus sp. 1P02AB TaxID=3132260 RepID=UPI0039A557E9